MTTTDLIMAIQAKRRAAGLVVSFDREDPEVQAEIGRATAAYANVKERDEEFDRLNWLGRNPRIER
jgi:hypothetical protein